MTVSQKQLAANRQNAKKGGVKSEEGKAIVKHNALKHGLLAKEIVITVGEGAENPEEFAALLDDLKEQLIPVGTMEEILVEKIAASYWRLRRAIKYEVGLIRKDCDSVMDNFYSRKDWDDKIINRAPEKIEKEILKHEKEYSIWKKDYEDFTKFHKDGKNLELIKDENKWGGNWSKLQDDVTELFDDARFHENWLSAEELRKALIEEQGWTDEDIWQRLIELTSEQVEFHKRKLDELNEEISRNAMKVDVVKLLGNIPSREALDKLIRYESSIERQFYKAQRQLERMQRIRLGENVPPAIDVDIEVNSENSET